MANALIAETAILLLLIVGAMYGVEHYESSKPSPNSIILSVDRSEKVKSLRSEISELRGKLKEAEEHRKKVDSEYNHMKYNASARQTAFQNVPIHEALHQAQSLEYSHRSSADTVAELYKQLTEKRQQLGELMENER